MTNTCASLSHSAEPAGLASSLFNRGDYYRAITEYKRLSFFTSNPQDRRWASYRIGESYRRSGRPEQALQHLYSGARFSTPDILTDSCGLSLAKAFIELGYYGAARGTLDSLRAGDVSSRAVLKGWSHLLEGDYQSGRNSFLNARTNPHAAHLAEICSRGEELPKRSPRAATVMSAVIPGSGQIYAGAYKQGIISFALHGLTAFFLYHSIKKERYFEAAAAFYTGFSRFYVGNVMSASRLAHEYNERERLKLVEEARQQYGSDLE